MSKESEQQDEIVELTWLLVDEMATEDQVRRLEQLLSESEQARQTYLSCVQLHTDLHMLLSEEKLHADVLNLLRDVKEAIVSPPTDAANSPISPLGQPRN